MAEIIMYSTGYCPYCTRARELFHKKNAVFTDIRVDLHPELREEMITKSGRRTVPQIFIDDQHIGGCDDLYALDAQGQLDQLLRG
ncbi:glutaredoxin Grx [Legionella sainthelensi]|uniref:Glutaredoxin n=1 Tax=Legionella sainthelensi TaxID=28087 RepID=A0A0W0YN10_9GAMM|nr:glutaredoxin 3 [Legionella sainthelensi]KTD58030.1 glutaredoxin Grx [Legionella sainthelensi]VEH28277.1 glutaredoxin Grx [Legionella sainthelensi]